MDPVTRWLPAAALMVCAVVIVAATNRPEPSASRRVARAPLVATPPPSAVAPDVELERTAVAFALAARNWSAATRLAAWRRQRALAGGRYRRLLERARPTRATERTSSIAIPASPPRSSTAGPRAQVLIELHERTTTARQVTTSPTRNQVSLRRRAGAWRVTGWTILPRPNR